MTKTANATTQYLLMHRVEEIQVSGGKCFAGNLWREALILYLEGIWSNDQKVVHRPKIMINDTIIRLSHGKYVGYYSQSEDRGRSSFSPNEIVVINPRQTEVEAGLIRFVRNNQIQQLTIIFPFSEMKGQMVLTKGRKRGELFIATEGKFPSQEEYYNSL